MKHPVLLVELFILSNKQLFSFMSWLASASGTSVRLWLIMYTEGKRKRSDLWQKPIYQQEIKPKTNWQHKNTINNFDNMTIAVSLVSLLFYSSGHLVLSHLGLAFVLMLRPFFPELVMSTDLLSLEHPSVLLFCLGHPFECQGHYDS